jgi:hypothetical protein
MGNLLFMIPMMRPRRATLLGSRSVRVRGSDRGGEILALLFDRHDHGSDVEDVTIIELTVDGVVVKVFVGTVTPLVTLWVDVLVSPLESGVAIRADAQGVLTAITIQDDLDSDANAVD